jgi:hypothetical protein
MESSQVFVKEEAEDESELKNLPNLVLKEEDPLTR